MANRYVRAYSPDNYTIIGASSSAAGLLTLPECQQFMEERGYETFTLPAEFRPKQGVSSEYTVVRPPLSQRHLEEFGKLCVGGTIRTRTVGALVDAGSNLTVVTDNRYTLPSGPYDRGGEELARGG